MTGTNLVPYIIVAIVSGILTAIGLVLCVIPGLLVVFFLLFAPIHALKGAGVGDALNWSFNAVKANVVPCIVLVLIGIVVGIISSFAGGIGGAVVAALLGLFIDPISSLLTAQPLPPDGQRADRRLIELITPWPERPRAPARGRSAFGSGSGSARMVEQVQRAQATVEMPLHGDRREVIDLEGCWTDWERERCSDSRPPNTNWRMVTAWLDTASPSRWVRHRNPPPRGRGRRDRPPSRTRGSSRPACRRLRLRAA